MLIQQKLIGNVNFVVGVSLFKAKRVPVGVTPLDNMFSCSYCVFHSKVVPIFFVLFLFNREQIQHLE